MSTELLVILREGTLATTLAALLVLLLRKPARRAFGAGCVPLLWALVPLAQLAVLLPGPASTPITEWIAMPAMGASIAALPTTSAIAASWNWQAWLAGAWLAGALLMAASLLLIQRRFQQRLGTLTAWAPGIFLAARADTGPAVLGILRPRIVLPADFLHRYSTEQQALILAHERSHARRGDVVAQAIASTLRCIYWFNPLLHFAARRLRHDHELASDADVVRQHPDLRRRYAATLLDAQLAAPGLPAGCLWQSSHPLKERIMLLKNLQPSRLRRSTGLALVIALACGSSFALWAAQPATTATSSHSTPAVSQALHQINMDIAIDGKTIATPELIVSPGKPFAIGLGNEAEGSAWFGEFVYDGIAGRLTRGEIKVNGQAVGPLDLAVLDAGQPLRMTLDDGRPMELRFTASIPADSNAEPVDAAAPPYPAQALASDQSGRILLAVKVDAQGHPTDIRVEASEPAGVFDEAATSAVANWRFRPAMREGKPVEEWVQVPICFSQRDASTESCEASEFKR